MNKVILFGYLSRDPEYKGNASKCTIAVHEYYNGEDKTTFINLIAFGRTADFMVKYFTKGQKVLIEGKILVSNYQGKYYTNIMVEKIESAGNNNCNKNLEEESEFDWGPASDLWSDDESFERWKDGY